MTNAATSAGSPVLIATSTFPVSMASGTPQFVLDLARALAANRPVMVLAPHAPGAPLQDRWGNVDIRRFRYFWPAALQRLASGDGMRENMRASLLAVLQVPFFFLAELAAIRRVLRERNFGVINSHWIIPQGLAVALLRGRQGRFRHVLHVHAAGVYMLQRMPFGSRIARFIVRRTDKVLADGSHVRDALDALLGKPSAAVLQPMGVWFDQVGREQSLHCDEEHTPEILFIGRLVEKKGVTYLLRAMPIVLRQCPDARLLIGGTGPLEDSLRSEVEQLGLADVVRFLGPLHHDEVTQRFRRCRVAVVPSIIDGHGETEGMPTVVVEAMAAGTRVVGSDVAGIPDVIRHGANGWLARPGDPSDLATQVIAALDDQGDEILEAAGATARRHDWPNIAQDYLALEPDQ